MILNLARYETNKQGVFGKITVEGQFFCYSLENPEFIIPAGDYPVELTPSGRVQAGTLWSPRPPLLPLILRVPDRSGIRIHAGNWAKDSQGCPLVGYDRTQDGIVQSRLALRALVAKMLLSLRANRIVITGV